MRLGTVDCWVEADGKPLDEYGVEFGDDGKSCVAWIPSKAGQEFAVSWRDLNPVPRQSAGYITADGNFVGGALLEGLQTMVRREGAQITADHIRRFRFGAVELTDDDSLLNKNLQNVGEIKIEIWRCRAGGYDAPPPLKVAESTRMHERSKKGLAHSVAFSQPQPLAKPIAFRQVTKLDAQPFATFTFRYRSIEMLRANGIAPLPEPAAPPRATSSASSPPVAGPSRGRKRKASSPLTPERDIKRDVKPVIIDMDEEAEAEERIRKAEDELRRARLEMHRRRGNTRIKLEQVLPILPGEVLDLTELSD
ncbi:hypothetical protein EV121DRAFT_296416 [Schizophyllum commune]